MTTLNTIKRQIDELAKTQISKLRGSLQDASSSVLVSTRQRKGGEAVGFMPMLRRPIDTLPPFTDIGTIT